MRVNQKITLDINSESLTDLIDTLQRINELTRGEDATVEISSYEIEVSFDTDI